MPHSLMKQNFNVHQKLYFTFSSFYFLYKLKRKYISYIIDILITYIENFITMKNSNYFCVQKYIINKYILIYNKINVK